MSREITAQDDIQVAAIWANHEFALELEEATVALHTEEEYGEYQGVHRAHLARRDDIEFDEDPEVLESARLLELMR